MLDMVVEDLQLNALERRVHRGELRQDVDAVAILVDHPGDLYWSLEVAAG